MEAKGIMERGMRWSINNATSVNVWRDRWLPTLESFKVISPKSQGSMVERVEHSLVIDKRAWDINEVRNTFLPFEAETVLGIPISPCLPNDSRIRAWTNNGIFSVKSVYGVALKVLKDNKEKVDNGDCSNTSRMGDVWKSIWRIECPGKIKHFLWRACKNIPPTNYCLTRRKVSKWDGCAWCGEKESSSHVLQDCKAAVEVNTSHWINNGGSHLPNKGTSQRH
nr:putative ribonuclease h protein [Quercus suber]